MAVVEGGGGRRAPRGRAPGFPGSPHAPPKPPVRATCSHEEGDRVARLGKAGSCRAPARSWGRSWGGRSHLRADRRAAPVRGTGWGTGTRTAPSSAQALGVGEGQRAVEETWGRWRRGL